MLSGGSLQGKGLWGGVHALLGRQDDARKVLEKMEAACDPPHFFEAVSYTHLTLPTIYSV